ncbi:MAG: DUF2057 domain-containing protein [Gammaproteobacteria bacterium]|nr:DUF2057 domain-containing protein [Gammaproteobacteria bacterium]
MRNLLCLFFAGLLTACAQQPQIKLYSGNEQPAKQLVIVEVPPTLEILDINDQAIPAANRMTGNQSRLLYLQPGEYRINAYYENVFDIDSGLSHEVIRSNSATFQLNGQAGENWRLGFDAPKDLEAARATKTGFVGWTENIHTGERNPAVAGPQHETLLTLLGSSGRAAHTVQNTVEPLGTSHLPNAPASQSLPHSDATLTTLQHLWLLLGSESRAAFLQWAAPEAR